MPCREPHQRNNTTSRRKDQIYNFFKKTHAIVFKLIIKDSKMLRLPKALWSLRKSVRFEGDKKWQIVKKTLRNSTRMVSSDRVEYDPDGTGKGKYYLVENEDYKLSLTDRVANALFFTELIRGTFIKRLKL